MVQVVLVAVVGLVGGQALCSMLRPPSDVSQRPSATAARVLPPMPAALPAEGRWILGNTPLSLGVEVVASDELAERMAVPPAGTLKSETVDFGDSSIFSSIKRICRNVEAIGEFNSYTLSQPRMRLRLFSAGIADRERLVSVYLAYPRGPEAWTLVVGTLCATATTPSGTLHLLPMTDLTSPLATRTGLDGALQCEVIELHGDLENAISAWRGLGWTVKRSGRGTSHEVLFCTCHDRQIQAHVCRQSGQDSRSLLLLVDLATLLDIETNQLWKEGASS
ncbi:MAG: hypothetical protein GXX96_37705 [Planctomycetaceae bacterium]|nr:hypothetical protein [Planctomycetaceae bacterium]